MQYLLAIILGYMLGCSSMAYYIGKFKKTDIRAAGVACVLGHIFPFYLGFRGDKGLASYFGMVLALNWKLALIIGAVIVLATLITDFISVGALSSIVVAPVYTFFTTHNLILVAILGVATMVMFLKHWENIIRIAKGQEIGLRRTAKGADRIDK